MYFESVADFGLFYSTALTGVFIALASLPIAFVPTLAIVWLPTSKPRRAILSIDKFRLPVTHTLTTAKIMLIDLGVFASKFLSLFNRGGTSIKDLFAIETIFIRHSCILHYTLLLRN